MVDEKPVTGQFSITPVLSAQSLKGAMLGLATAGALVCLVLLVVKMPPGPTSFGMGMVCVITLIHLSVATYYLGLPAWKAMGTMFVAEEESLQLFNDQVELGQMRREDIHSIAWSQAPSEWINMTKLELKDREGITRLALPIPFQFSPLQKHPGELSCLLYRENRKWQSFVDQIRKQCEGREELEADFDISVSRLRYHLVAKWINLVFSTLMMFGFYGFCLMATGLIPDSGFLSTGMAPAVFCSMGASDMADLKPFGSRELMTYRTMEWQKVKHHGQRLLPAGHYRYAYPTLVASLVRSLCSTRRFLAALLGLLAVSIAITGATLWVQKGAWMVGLGSLALAALIGWLGVRCFQIAESDATMLQNLDSAHEFREDGSLRVIRPSGVTLELTTTDSGFLKRWRPSGTYTDGTTKYLVCPAYMDPVPEAQEAEEVARDGR
jgi:hypothetical protein